MRAIDAAEHSDVIQMQGNTPCYKIDNQWYNHGEKICHMHLYGGDYVPLVPKKIYKVGDQVNGLEAISSGMVFAVADIVYRWEEQFLWQYAKDDQLWHLLNGVSLHWVANQNFTLVEDPSVPPKPTLESLSAWTRCKVKPVNHHSNWDVIKKPSGSLMHYYSGNDFEWVNVELIAIYNPKTEQWEDV